MEKLIERFAQYSDHRDDASSTSMTGLDGGRQALTCRFSSPGYSYARIFTYGYNSGIAFTGSASRVEGHARTLLERLMAKRRQFSHVENRPLLFICHRLGGVVVKRALVMAHERSTRYSSITKDTFGIMFLGTPHRGSDAAFYGKLFGILADVLTPGSVRTQLLDDLKRKADVLGARCSQFVQPSQALHRVFSVYERVRVKGLSGLVPEDDSAIMRLPNEIPIPIEADHRSMCRFSSMKIAISTGQKSWSDLQYSLGFNFDAYFDQAFGYLLRVDPDMSVGFSHTTVKKLLTSANTNIAPSVHDSQVLSKFLICEAMADGTRDFFVTSLQGEEALQSLNFAKYDEPDSVYADQETSDRSGKAILKLGQAELGERRRKALQTVTREPLRRRDADIYEQNKQGLNTIEQIFNKGLDFSLFSTSFRPDVISTSRDCGSNLLILCAQQDWEQVAKVLVHRFSVDGDATGGGGKMIAHWASEFQWASLSSLLTARSKDWLDKTNYDGQAALHIAAEYRNETACKALLQAGCLPVLRPQVDVRDHTGRSPLHFACIFGNESALSVLLEIGADPNLRDTLSFTPLHHALKAGSVECAQTLIRHGAGYDILDGFSRNVILLAVCSGDRGMVEYVARLLSSNLSPQELGKYATYVDCFGRSALHYLCHWVDRRKLEDDDAGEIILEDVNEEWEDGPP
ncbi:hypothetical protein DL765_006755 [Monosporascus sp. GIB2]|nr:hypothetical protein DL765_006755 [Monosporascus sp. GIB2]